MHTRPSSADSNGLEGKFVGRHLLYQGRKHKELIGSPVTLCGILHGGSLRSKVLTSDKKIKEKGYSYETLDKHDIVLIEPQNRATYPRVLVPAKDVRERL